jgi:hypothetical protein
MVVNDRQGVDADARQAVRMRVRRQGDIS